MAKKENAEKSIMVGKLKLFNSISKESIIIADDEMVKYDIIIYGHTHKVDLKEGKPLIINPGECGGWITGSSTIAVLDTDKLKAEILELK